MTDPAPSPFLVLQARAEARAILFADGAFETIEQAIAPLLNDAQALIDQVGNATVLTIIQKPFAE